jgi:hypothetical protein
MAQPNPLAAKREALFNRNFEADMALSGHRVSRHSFTDAKGVVTTTVMQVMIQDTDLDSDEALDSLRAKLQRYADTQGFKGTVRAHTFEAKKGPRTGKWVPAFRVFEKPIDLLETLVP